MGRNRETLHHLPSLQLKEATLPGVCPAWKATGNSTLVEQGWPVQSYLLWLLSHFHLPLHSCCFLFQRSEVCVPMWTPHWCSRSRAVPGTSPITGRIRMPPMVPTDMPQPLSGLHCSLHPQNHFFWWPARWLPGIRRRGNSPLKRPQCWRGPRTAWSTSQEHRSARKCPQPICQPAQQKHCFQPNS